MDSQIVKVIIVDNDAKKAADIKSAMPDYFDASILKYKDVKEYLASENNRADVKLMVMDADAGASMALEIYKYLCEDPEKYMLRRIPVVLLIEDEFSDITLDYYDLGEPYFFEGDLDDSDFYMTVTKAVEDGELLDDKDLYPELFVEENKPKPSQFSPEKIMGASFEVHVGEDAPSRIATYDNKQIIEKITKYVEKNKENAAKIREVLEKAAEEKRAQGEEAYYIPRRKREKVVNKISHASENPSAEYREAPKAGKKPGLHYQMPDKKKANMQSGMSQNAMSQNMTRPDNMMPNMAQANMMQGGMMQNGMVKNAPSNVMKKDSFNQGAQPEDKNRRKKILIVDSDQRTLKAFKLFVGDDVDIVLFESGMKVIDYFSKQRADMVIIEYDMPGLPGMSILKSIWMQPYGREVKAAIMMSPEKTDIEKFNVLKTPGITGVIDKPIVKKQLLSVVNRGIV